MVREIPLRMERRMHIETLAVHAGRPVDPATGAVALPIHLTTTFERDPDGSYPRGHLYARNSNPTREALERCLAALERGAAAAAFASGSAATAAVFQALAPGDHVIAPHDCYHGTGRLLRETFTRWGLATTFADMTDLAAVERAVRPATRLVWVETPSNPMWKISDIRALASLAHGAGARCVCDNTVATPSASRPSISERTSSCTRRRSISAGTVTSWAARSSRAPTTRCGRACARSRHRPAGFRPRSTAGSSCAGSRRCRGGCARTARTR
jgi:cystathionine beta-lyase/cystathionine gamma-synthase